MLGDNVFRRLYWVILNSKFHSLLVLILIQKDNTDNKIFETNFIQKRESKDGNLSFFAEFSG